MNNHRRHATVVVEVGDQAASIDVDIAPLIRELWRARICTSKSCQENRPGIVWIQFPTERDAATFLGIVAEYEKGIDTLYNRIANVWKSEHVKLAFWEYKVHPTDLSLQLESDESDQSRNESHQGISEFVFSVSIRFPKEDVSVLIERLRQHNENLGGLPLWWPNQAEPPDAL